MHLPKEDFLNQFNDQEVLFCDPLISFLSLPWPTVNSLPLKKKVFASPWPSAWNKNWLPRNIQYDVTSDDSHQKEINSILSLLFFKNIKCILKKIISSDYNRNRIVDTYQGSSQISSAQILYFRTSCLSCLVVGCV